MKLIEDKKYRIYAYIAIAVIILFLYLLPYFIFSESCHILIHDNLDSNFVIAKVISENRQIFDSLNSTVANFLNGIPRNVMGTELNFNLWLYAIFNPFKAYVINIILMHSIAFIGMYALLKEHFLKKNEDTIIITGVALCFSILPFFPFGGLTVAGLPLALYAFLNFRSKKSTKVDWILLFLIPFYSSFYASFIFFLFLMGVLWLYDFIRTKKCNFNFLFSIIFMTLIFLIVEYRLIYNMFFDSSYVSHRMEFLSEGYNFFKAIKISIKNFTYGQYHAASLQQYFILIAVGIAILVMFFKKIMEKRLIIFIIITFAISLWYGFWQWEGLNFLKNQINILNSFNITRFHWLHPLLWYIIFALALSMVKKYLKYGNYIVLIFIILQICFLFYNSNEFIERRKGNPTYREFFAEELFSEVKEYIGQDQEEYRVVSIGLYPSIAQYNGFYTLDGYFPNYPLSYKHKFRNIIEDELDKNIEIRDYFDNWGSRCYVFVDELGSDYIVAKDKKIVINNLQLNTNILKQMGCEYIFSAVKINNSIDNDLKLLKVFDNEVSAWKIYLYEIY